LVRYRVTGAVGVPGALMIGGWASNLLDRLGVHYWTAPGSVRGVVDFIHAGGHYYNVADLFIISCTPLFLLAVACQGVLAATRPAVAARVAPPARAQAWIRARVRARLSISALVGAGLILAAAFGAANYGGVAAASQVPAQQNSVPAGSGAAVTIPGG
jgi:hypothetical protein